MDDKKKVFGLVGLIVVAIAAAVFFTMKASSGAGGTEAVLEYKTKPPSDKEGTRQNMSTPQNEGGTDKI